MYNFFLSLLDSILFIKTETIRTVLYSGGIVFLIWLSNWFPKASGHPEFAPLLTCSYMIMLLVIVAHFIRCALFHKLKLQAIAIKAIDEKNMPAAIVFMSVVFILATAMYILASMLR